jgi:DNA polymerase III subunit gamma/tau
MSVTLRSQATIDSMSYQPLHHKYRPQTFAQLVGQDAISTTLSNALRQNRIAPAYLFTGSRGTGKTSSARIFAKSLNCISVDAPTDQPCGICQTCQEITKGVALDVIEIDAASNTGVDNIRELIERAQFAPVQCRYKVYAIDEVHMLSNAAFNALLKTLEEPPERVVFVLATTDPQRVLPTIISRCQRFDFRRIPLEAMIQHLGMIAQKEQIPIADDALYLIAQISQGGMRDAESLLDQLSLLAGDITADRVWDLVGAVPERDLMALLEAIAQDNPEMVLDTIRRLMDRGREPIIVLQNLASFYRDLLIAKTSPKRGDLVALTTPTWECLCEFAESLALPTILAGQRHLKESEVQIKHTTQPRLWLEVTLMGLLPSAIQSTIATEAVNVPQVTQKPAPRLAQAAPSRESTPTPNQPKVETSVPDTPKQEIPNPPVAAEVEPPAPEPESSNLDELWQKVIQNIQVFGTQALLKQQGMLLSFDGEEAQIGMASDQLLNIAKGRLKHIQAAFAKTFGKEIKFTMVVAPTPSTTSASAASPFAETPATQGVEPSAIPSEGRSAIIEPAISDSRTDDPTESEAQFLASTPLSEVAPYIPQDWHDDEVMRAARDLMETFNGAVVNLDDSDVTMPAGSVEDFASIDASVAEDPEDAEEDDEDVPF